jgi:hypothetical protein
LFATITGILPHHDFHTLLPHLHHGDAAGLQTGGDDGAALPCGGGAKLAAIGGVGSYGLSLYGGSRNVQRSVIDVRVCESVGIGNFILYQQITC